MTRGSGNVFRDLQRPNADAEQLKAKLATAIIKRMDKDGFNLLSAHIKTGIAVADLYRVRNTDLRHFTVDALTTVIILLGAYADVATRASAASTP